MLLVLARPWAGQMAAWAAAALAPRLVISVMTAPGRAIAAATRKGVVHPGGERGVADPGDLAGELGRRVAGYGRCAGGDRAFHAGQLGGAERGKVRGVPAARQHGADLGGHRRAEHGGAEGAANLHG